jgi:hypothetical protein
LPADNSYHYRASIYDPGTDAWSTPTWVEEHRTGSTTEPAVLADDADGDWISYRRSGAFHTDRYEPGVGFDAPAQHDFFGNAASTQRLLLAKAGDAWAFWREHDGSHYNVIGRHHDGALGWGQATPIDDNDDDGAGLRSVVVDSEGTPTVIWSHDAGSVRNLRASCYDAGPDVWSTPQDVETSLELAATRPPSSMATGTSRSSGTSMLPTYAPFGRTGSSEIRTIGDGSNDAHGTFAPSAARNVDPERPRE